MDEYDKMAIVGRGTFGTVYLSRKDSGKRVVMKQIVIEHLQKNELEETVEEVKVMALLDHPHIIKYYDSFIENGTLTIVMEFATKGTLCDYLQKQKDLLPQEKIVYLFSQMCLALQYMHSKRILHRDITTRNILLTGCRGHVVKLSDFGISKVLTSRNKTASVVGTPCYMSPELCEGKPYGTHSDVWALGCVIYNMCTLRQAFQAPSLVTLVFTIIQGVIEPISDKYDAGLTEILQLMMERDSLTRPSVSAILAHRLIAPVICLLPVTIGRVHDTWFDDPKGHFYWET